MEMTHQADGPAHTDAVCGLMRVNMVRPESNYCARIDDIKSYGEVNREVRNESGKELSMGWIHEICTQRSEGTGGASMIGEWGLSPGAILERESFLSAAFPAHCVPHCRLAPAPRQVADPHAALHLTGMRPSKYDNVVAESATIGSKTTIAAACIVGENCVLGDKSSIKRSILGNGCK